MTSQLNADAARVISAGIKKLRTIFENLGREDTLQEVYAWAVYHIIDNVVNDSFTGEGEGFPLSDLEWDNRYPRERISANYPEYAGPSIENSWGQIDRPIAGGYSATLVSSAVHIEWLIKGTKRHDIPFVPGEYKRPGVKGLVFHWGDPLKWEPKDGKPDGIRFYKRVDHPGIQPRDYIAEMIDVTMDENLRTFIDASMFLLRKPFREAAGERFPEDLGSFMDGELGYEYHGS